MPSASSLRIFILLSPGQWSIPVDLRVGGRNLTLGQRLFLAYLCRQLCVQFQHFLDQPHHIIMLGFVGKVVKIGCMDGPLSQNLFVCSKVTTVEICTNSPEKPIQKAAV